MLAAPDVKLAFPQALCVYVRLMIHGITAVVALWNVCALQNDTNEWKWAAALETTVSVFPLFRHH